MAEAIGDSCAERRNVGTETLTGWQVQPQASNTGEGVPIARQLVGEFIGTFAFVFIAVTTTYWWYPDFVAMGLACGIAVGVLAASFSSLGSGQFNPAITLGMLVGGKLRLTRALFIFPVQVLAAVMACFILSSSAVKRLASAAASAFSPAAFTSSFAC